MQLCLNDALRLIVQKGVFNEIYCSFLLRGQFQNCLLHKIQPSSPKMTQREIELKFYDWWIFHVLGSDSHILLCECVHTDVHTPLYVYVHTSLECALHSLTRKTVTNSSILSCCPHVTSRWFSSSIRRTDWDFWNKTKLQRQMEIIFSSWGMITFLKIRYHYLQICIQSSAESDITCTVMICRLSQCCWAQTVRTRTRYVKYSFFIYPLWFYSAACFYFLMQIGEGKTTNIAFCTKYSTICFAVHMFCFSALQNLIT